MRADDNRVVPRRALVALTAVSLLVVPAGAALSQQAPVVEAARQVTTDVNPVRLFPTPAIAVDPNDPLVAAVAVADARNGGCGVHLTRDGGLSWSTTAENLLPEGLDYCVQNNNGPYISAAYAADGTLYVGFGGSSRAEGHPRAPVNALVSRVEPSGAFKTFPVSEAEPYRYEPAGEPVQVGYEQKRYSSLAVDPNDSNRLYMGWRQSVGGIKFGDADSPQNYYIATSSDGGRSWSEPVDLMATLTGEQAGTKGGDLPMPVVAPDGTVHVFIKEADRDAPEGAKPPPTRIFMFSSADEAGTWTGGPIKDGGQSVALPVPAVDASNGNLYVTWENYADNELFFIGSSTRDRRGAIRSTSSIRAPDQPCRPGRASTWHPTVAST